MNKIVEYKIVTNDLDNTIEDNVNALIKQGWQPYGPVSEDLNAQAMVRYETPPSKKKYKIGYVEPTPETVPPSNPTGKDPHGIDAAWEEHIKTHPIGKDQALKAFDNFQDRENRKRAKPLGES
jgi:hypothetical protein